MQQPRSQVISHTLDFRAWLAEIEQQAKLQARSPKIIHTLRAMRLIQRFHRLQLDQQPLLHHQIREILTNYRAIVNDLNPTLLHHSEPSLPRFMHQRVPINLLQKPCSSVLCTVKAQPITAPDSPFSLSPSAFICVHLCLSA
jgi:hypothetical protein